VTGKWLLKWEVVVFNNETICLKTWLALPSSVGSQRSATDTNLQQQRRTRPALREC